MFPGLHDLPKLERVLERSMMACLLGLLRTERLAREMSAVTRVIDILKEETPKKPTPNELDLWARLDVRQKDKANGSAVEKRTQTGFSKGLLKPVTVRFHTKISSQLKCFYQSACVRKNQMISAWRLVYATMH